VHILLQESEEVQQIQIVSGTHKDCGPKDAMKCADSLGHFNQTIAMPLDRVLDSHL